MVWGGIAGAWAALFQGWAWVATAALPAVPCPPPGGGFLEQTIRYAVTLLRIASGASPC